MKLPNYEIIEKIYESNNSIVFRAKRMVDGKMVMIKLLNDKYPSKEIITKFKYEYEILKDLNIDGVIKVYDLEQIEKSFAIVEEDFGGLPLKQYYPQNLNLGVLLKIFIEITEVLGRIQEANIIHKDINPSNILWNKEVDQVKIIDFGISTKLSLEKAESQNPESLEGTLNYIAPEQTGRMNRPIDYRTDFYSLGATFYELLTKQVPFINTKDAMELVHCHIAKQPLAPHEINKNIPEILSQIILKLMSKNAEDRYQSVFGIQSDLKKCLDYWKATGSIYEFEIGKNDNLSRFQIPQKLYGREKELEVLTASFIKVCEGNTEIVLVSGFSGIGKTSLINEIQKLNLEHRGYYISGKYDLFKRNIPYSAIINSFRDLVKQILTESTEKITLWKETFSKTLGANGQVIVNVIPEFELIIGKQEVIQTLSPSESQNRFNFVFQNFVNTFTREGNPLVLFLDDLQWADSASLQLLHLLGSNPENKYLFFIGAYRDNETDKSHPLILTIDSIEKIGVRINRIELGNLELLQINQLIADLLSSSLNKTKPLSELIFSKTNGNPFFVNELLKLLSKNNLIHFDKDSLSWNWDIQKISALGLSDNVVDLMAGKIQKLSDKTQGILKLASCLGNFFDLNILSILSEKSKTETASNLWEALQEGMILPLDDSYKYIHDMENVNPHYKIVHDRIRQAAYQLIPENEKEAVHLKIARLFLEHFSLEEREEKIFDITNHLNIAVKLISDEKEIEELIACNLQSARKAKKSAAFTTAKEYLNKGIQLLKSDSWEKQYSLSLGLYGDAAEIACVNGEFEKLEQLTKTALENAKSITEKARIYDIQITSYMAQNNPSAAIKTVIHTLSLLGIHIPEQPSEAEIGAGIVSTHALWANSGIDSLLNLPEMTEPDKLLAVQVISTVMPITYVVAPMLVPLLTFAMIDLSVKYGNAHASAFGYASYGLVLCGALGDVDNGYLFGKLAIKLLDHLNAKEFKARTNFYVYLFITHWKRHLNESLVPLLEGYQSGLETGDIVNSTLGAMQYCVHAYVSGKELTGLALEMEKFGNTMRKLKQDFVLLFNELYYQAVLSWFQKGDNPNEPHYETYYQKMLPVFLETHNMSALWIVYLNRLIFNYSFQDYTKAIEDSIQAEQNIAAASGSITLSQFYLFDSLVRLASYKDVSDTEKEVFLNKVSANQEKMAKWAKNAPMNFMHKFYLVEGEKCKVLGQKEKAWEYYDKAIALAKESEFIQEEALANEVAGRFWIDCGKEEFAGIYLRKAYYDYEIWGATIKLDALKVQYPVLLKMIEENKKSKTDITSISTTSGFLDITTIVKSSQIISGEIVLENLLIRMIYTLIENAGADRGLLLLEKNKDKKDFVVQAEGFSSEQEPVVLQSIPFEKYTNLPTSIIQYVSRTGQNVVLDDAGKSGLFTKDSYLVEHEVKSILCSPIFYQNKLTGIIYLENNLTTGAFTEERIEILKVLSAQAAISIENSLLYANLEEKVKARTVLLEEAHKKILLLEKENTEKQMAGGFAHEMRNALVGPKLVIQHALGLEGDKESISLNLENSRKLKEIYLSLQKELPTEKLQSILNKMKVIFSNEEELEESLNIIYRSISKGLSITTQIMDYSKVGHEKVGKETIDVDRVLTNIVKDNNAMLSEKEISIQLQLNGSEVFIKGLESHFDSIFKNLFNNAIDALLDKSIQDGRKKCIYLLSRIEENKYIVEITDNGVGISPENISKIFNAFYSTKPDTGTGLGLGMVQKICFMYNGIIDVKSELGQGTTFTVAFPLKKSKDV